MKTILVLILLSISILPQDRTMDVRGNTLELGMTMEDVWNNLKADLNVIEGEDGNFYISDKYDAPVAVVIFKDEKVIKILKDWGTTYKNNVGQVFKVLWKIFKQYDKDLDEVKVIPLETYSPKGDKISLQFYLTENRFIEISIQHTCSIYEVIEDIEN
jgi:hypothetical protein